MTTSEIEKMIDSLQRVILWHLRDYKRCLEHIDEHEKQIPKYEEMLKKYKKKLDEAKI